VVHKSHSAPPGKDSHGQAFGFWGSRGTETHKSLVWGRGGWEWMDWLVGGLERCIVDLSFGQMNVHGLMTYLEDVRADV